MLSRTAVGVSTDSTTEIFRSFGLTSRYLKEHLKLFSRLGLHADDSLEEYFREKCSGLIVNARVRLLQHIFDRLNFRRQDESRVCLAAESNPGEKIVQN